MSGGHRDDGKVVQYGVFHMENCLACVPFMLRWNAAVAKKEFEGMDGELKSFEATEVEDAKKSIVEKYSKLPTVDGYPTIYKVVTAGDKYEYLTFDGARDVDAIKGWLMSKSSA